MNEAKVQELFADLLTAAQKCVDAIEALDKEGVSLCNDFSNYSGRPSAIQTYQCIDKLSELFGIPCEKYEVCGTRYKFFRIGDWEVKEIAG